MKSKILILTLLIGNLLGAQEFSNLKIDVLVAQLPYANKSIKIQFENEKVYYVNSVNNTKLFTKGFEEGYPFFQKCAIVKEKGKYGIMDVNGTFRVPPVYNTFELAPYEHESYIVIFNQNNVYDLNTGEQSSYTICEEPASPELYAFLGKNNKYGVKRNGNSIIKPAYDTIYAVENEFIIASKDTKIGIITPEEKKLTSFNYDSCHVSEDTEFEYTYPIFGLEKNGIWTYFHKGKKIIESNYKCTSFLSLLDKSIGVFEINGQKNILFKDGGTLDQNFDFISTNGLVAVKKNIVYLLYNDRSYEVCYIKKEK